MKSAHAGKRKALKLFDPGLDYGLLSELTGFRMRRASVIDFASFGEASGDPTITPLRFSVLELIGANPGLQQVQIGQALGLSRPAVSVTIDFWEQRGCVERRPAPDDRRSNGIYLTSKGEDRLGALQKQVAAHDRKLTVGLTETEIDELHRLLEKIYLN
jgi:DNA-binding MarR family transcriptional regulator